MDNKIDRFFYKLVAHELDLKRKKLDYSFRYLSSLTGISRNQLDQYFLGRFRIDDDNFKIICEALGLNPKIKIELKIEEG